MSELYSITLVNNSNIITNDEIYIVGKGQDPTNNSGSGTYNGKTYDFTMIESYIGFDSSGVGTFTRVDAATSAGKTSADFCIKLSDLPNGTIQVPMTVGGRIYICFKYTLGLSEVVGYDANNNPVTLTIGEPDPFDQSDSNYAKIYDKIEYTYNQDGVWIDTTAVDFFCLPLTLAVAGETVGLTESRATILNRLAQGTTALKGLDNAGGDWGNLILNFKGTVLRVVAPNKAVGTNGFDPDYLNSYLNTIWQYYGTEGTTLSVDCSEVYPSGSTQSQTLYTGSVQGSAFNFKNGESDTVSVPSIPTSNEVFGCGQGVMQTSGANVYSVIVRNLGAAMNVGVVPVAGGPTLNKAWFQSQKSSFYSPNTLAPSGGPWYNLYAGLLHSFGDKVYAFAFDDAVGEDSTLHTTDPGNNPSTVTIGDMTGTTVPNLSDDTIYTVKFEVASGCSGSYTNPNDGNKVYQLTGGTNVSVPNVKAPIVFSYAQGGNGAQNFTVNIQPPSSQPAGVGIDSSASPSITLALPGAPITNKVAVKSPNGLYNLTLNAAAGYSGSINGNEFIGGPGGHSASANNEPASFEVQYGKTGATMVNYQINIETGETSPTINGLVVVQSDPQNNPQNVTVNLPAGL